MVNKLLLIPTSLHANHLIFEIETVLEVACRPSTFPTDSLLNADFTLEIRFKLRCSRYDESCGFGICIVGEPMSCPVVSHFPESHNPECHIPEILSLYK